MSAQASPSRLWALTEAERRMRRALRDLSPEDRAVAEAIVAGHPERLYPAHVIEQTKTRIRNAYKEA